MSRRLRQGASGIPEGFPLRAQRAVLAGLDGLEPEDGGPEPGRGPVPGRPLRLTREARARVRAEIERAGGREVCFLAEVDESRRVHDPRAVSRGNFDDRRVIANATQDTGSARCLQTNLFDQFEFTQILELQKRPRLVETSV